VGRPVRPKRGTGVFIQIAGVTGTSEGGGRRKSLGVWSLFNPPKEGMQ
jgi:hypothetical protein